jgi:serine/threonine protein phosphatase PrpC
MRLQKDVRKYFEGRKKGNCILSGCVVTVVVVVKGKLIVGHVGDNVVSVYRETNIRSKEVVVDIAPVHSPLDV